MFPEYLQHFDSQLFFLINKTWANELFDRLMPPVRDKYFFIPLYIVIAVFLVFRFRLNSLWIMILFAVNLTCSDQISSAVLKPLFQRDRPCREVSIQDQVHLRVDQCGGGKSFPSSHAANAFAFATLLWLLLRRYYGWVAYPAFIWAAMIAYAQVYVGLHYPFDVFCGGILGAGIALLLFTLSRRYIGKRLMWE